MSKHEEDLSIADVRIQRLEGQVARLEERLEALVEAVWELPIEKDRYFRELLFKAEQP